MWPKGCHGHRIPISDTRGPLGGLCYPLRFRSCQDSRMIQDHIVINLIIKGISNFM